MQIDDALERIDLIHHHLTRSEVYRGFRVPTVAAVGVLGLVAAALQPFASAIDFTWYWTGIAAAGGLLGTAAALHAFVCREDEFERRRTRRVMSQFSPCLLAGAAVTLGIARAPELVSFLPALWAVLFGLGVVAAGPHLPRGIALIGLGYVVAGSALLLTAGSSVEPSPWSVGGIFGVGHLVTAAALWRGREADAHAGLD